MAGSGIKLFLPGDVLYASDVNSYLMDQVVSVFSDPTERDSAFGDGIPLSLGGDGKPSLSAGRFCFLEDNGAGQPEVQYFDGSAWQSAPQFSIPDDFVSTAKLQDGSVTSDKIANGTIVNADINNSAAIAHTKLANITAGSVLIGNASNVPTATALTGDVTVNSSGVTAIGSGVIVNADISGSAAIDKAKISGTAITAADTGTVTATMLASDSVTQAKMADRAVGSAELDNLTLNAQTGTTYTLVLADAHKLVTLNNSSAITLTVPTDVSVNFEIGDQVNLLQLGTGQVTVGGAGVNIRSEGSKLKLAGRYAIATLVKIDSNEWVLVGNLAA